jgi:uncharacterized protein (TIGR00725 family)
MGSINTQKRFDKPDRRPVVAVIGASSAEEPALEAARQVGRAISREGWHLLTGGGAGVMEAACRGFIESRSSSGGMTIGILPSDDTGFSNQFVEIAIPTGMGWARNAIITRTASALIAIGGCSGTLSEIAFGWQMGRPIAALCQTGGWAEKLAGEALDDRRNDVIFAAKNASEAVDFVKSNL